MITYNLVQQSCKHSFTHSLQHDWGLHWEPGHESGLKTVCASRHTYENVARSFVVNISNVTIQTNAAVKGLLYDAASAQVTGKISL